MAHICSFLLLAVITVLTFGVFCKDLQSLGLHRRSLSKLDSRILSYRANALGGKILNREGKYARLMSFQQYFAWDKTKKSISWPSLERASRIP